MKHSGQPWCSQCHKLAGEVRFVCALVYERDMGDHGETMTQAAGIFCSTRCLREWMERPEVDGGGIEVEPNP